MWFVVLLKVKPKCDGDLEEVKKFREPLSLVTPGKTESICVIYTQLSVRETQVCWVRNLTGGFDPTPCPISFNDLSKLSQLICEYSTSLISLGTLPHPGCCTLSVDNIENPPHQPSTLPPLAVLVKIQNLCGWNTACEFAPEKRQSLTCCIFSVEPKKYYRCPLW